MLVTWMDGFNALLAVDLVLQGLIQGKLDQKNRHFVVKYAVGRDTHHADIDSMIEKLTNWCVDRVVALRR